MRLVAPGAGSQPGGIARRRFLQFGLAGGMALAGLGAHAAGSNVISPGPSYAGARIIRRQDPQGMPDLSPEGFGQMTFFVFPVGVAASPFGIYIADAGLSVLLRYDPAVDGMIPLPGIRVSQETRITAHPDGSVVVAEGRLGVARRYSRTGRLMQTIESQNVTSRFDQVVVAPSSGKYFALDRVQRRVEEVHPLGRLGAPLPENLLPQMPTQLAIDEDILYAAGQDCQCVMAVDLFRRDRQVLVEDLPQVSAMAAGEGWLVVADNIERTLRIYRDKILRGDPSYDSLMLVNPQGMSISNNTLYVADSGTRRIATFHLRR